MLLVVERLIHLREDRGGGGGKALSMIPYTINSLTQLVPA